MPMPGTHNHVGMDKSQYKEESLHMLVMKGGQSIHSHLYISIMIFPHADAGRWNEIILNDTLKVAAKLKDAGVLVTQTTHQACFMCSRCCFPELEDANKAWEKLGVHKHILWK